jgi:hypothetical protein
MPSPETGRHRLPLLVVTQAQKELTHNEALIRIDALLHPSVEAELSTPLEPNDSDIGKCWLVGGSATGIWSGRSGQLAVWIGGSWRFCQPTRGMRIKMASTGVERSWNGIEWMMPPAIEDVTGGSIIDIETRAALNALLLYLRAAGIITG